MKSHDRFEALSGAVALGEATPEEAAAFAAHADGCALCRDDARSFAASPLSRIVEAREEEVWRPTLDRAIVSRIHDRQSERSRFTVGALGWAAGLSIAANVVFATGFSAQIANAIAPPQPVTPIASLAIRLPAQTFARPMAIPPAAHVERAAPRPVRIAVHVAPRRTVARAHVAERAHVAIAQASPPDVFADLLDENASRTGKNVAVETAFARNEPLQP